MAETTNRTETETQFRPSPGCRGFPFSAVPVTASKGAGGSWPGRAGLMIPPRLQGALWRELRHLAPHGNGGRDGDGASFGNPQEAPGLSATRKAEWAAAGTLEKQTGTVEAAPSRSDNV